MPLKFIRDDIVNVRWDAAIVPTNGFFSGGGNVETRIREAGGKQLEKEIAEAVRFSDSPAYVRVSGMNFKALILVPVMSFGQASKGELFGSVLAALDKAVACGCKTVALPLLGAGANGYPSDVAFDTVLDACRNHLTRNDTYIILTLYDDEMFLYGKRMYDDIDEYITGRVTVQHRRPEPILYSPSSSGFGSFQCENDIYEALHRRKNAKIPEEAACADAESMSLDEYIRNVDKGFSETLLDLIDKSGMTDVQCYKRANIDRKLFSKIRSTPGYKPKKSTAISFCIALSLTLEQTQDLLSKAGYTLSGSDVGDLIVEYFIKNKDYDIFRINEALFAFDQTLLGV